MRIHTLKPIVIILGTMVLIPVMAPAATGIVTIHTPYPLRILHSRPLPFTRRAIGQTVMLSRHTRLTG
jgi:hypothetical protein